MKKIALIIALAATFALTANAQEKIKIGGDTYNTADIDSITYGTAYIQVPHLIAEDSRYTIFNEALKLTGLVDSLWAYDKNKTYTVADPVWQHQTLLYYPTSCKIQHTVFAETDSVFAKNGINNVKDLIAFCNTKYGNASQWYDYLKENNITVSTADDYTNRFNALNMFIAYHIINIGAQVDELVYERNTKTQSTWNYCFGYEPNNYFETMLPHTIMKLWGIDVDKTDQTQHKLYINRWRKNNSLTEEYGTMGAEATHPILFEGVPVVHDTSRSIECYNGWIHEIGDVLLYDANTVASQQERMRFDSSSLLPELYNNGFVNATVSEIAALNNGGDGNRVMLPLDLFDNMRFYDENPQVVTNIKGAWRALNSDQFQLYGATDYAIKLPPVPTGTYEIRIIYPPMARGGIKQFYLGTSSDKASMTAVGIPVDMEIDPTQPNNTIGCAQIIGPDEYYWSGDNVVTDYGIATDRIMKNNGYMRAPASFSRGGNNMITTKLEYNPDDPYSAAKYITGSTSCRSEWGYGTMMLRKIITTSQLEQGKDYWLRVKDVLPTAAYGDQIGSSLDFIEIVPVSVVNNQEMMEDWY